MKSNMKKSILDLSIVALAVTGSLAISSSADGAVVLQHWYEMGESGVLPSDSQGSADFGTANGSAATTVAGSSGAPGSTSYLQYAAGSYSSGADLNALPNDNFAVGGWFKVDTILESRNDVEVFSGGSTGPKPVLMLGDGGGGDADGWAGTYTQVAWIGPSRGTEGSATAGDWAHLAIVRDNGTSSFYINGTAQSPTTPGLPDWSSGATVGSLDGITGQGIGVDDIRIYTFAAGEGGDAVSAFFTAIPEPSSAALLGLGSLALILRRRRQ